MHQGKSGHILKTFFANAVLVTKNVDPAVYCHIEVYLVMILFHLIVNQFQSIMKIKKNVRDSPASPICTDPSLLGSKAGNSLDSLIQRMA